MPEISISRDRKPQVAIQRKEVATLQQRLQHILSRIHQYRVRIINKPGPDLFIADWLSRQKHKENKNDEIPSRKINTDAIHIMTDTPNCMTEIQQAMGKDDHLQHPREHIIKGWSESGNEVKEIRSY